MKLIPFCLMMPLTYCFDSSQEYSGKIASLQALRVISWQAGDLVKKAHEYYCISIPRFGSYAKPARQAGG